MTDPALLRAVVLVVLAVTIGALAAVTVLYWRVWRLLHASGVAKGRQVRHARQVPVHVALMGLGVLTIEAALAWALIAGFRAPLTGYGTARMIMYGVGSGLIVSGLVVIANLQHHRVRVCRQQPRVVVETTEQVAVEPGESR